jgi:hypothetical protein
LQFRERRRVWTVCRFRRWPKRVARRGQTSFVEQHAVPAALYVATDWKPTTAVCIAAAPPVSAGAPVNLVFMDPPWTGCWTDGDAVAPAIGWQMAPHLSGTIVALNRDAAQLAGTGPVPGVGYLFEHRHARAGFMSRTAAPHDPITRGHEDLVPRAAGNSTVSWSPSRPIEQDTVFDIDVRGTGAWCGEMPTSRSRAITVVSIWRNAAMQ